MIMEISLLQQFNLIQKIKKEGLLLFLTDLEILVLKENLRLLLYMDVKIQVKTVQLHLLEDKSLKKIILLH